MGGIRDLILGYKVSDSLVSCRILVPQCCTIRYCRSGRFPSEPWRPGVEVVSSLEDNEHQGGGGGTGGGG